MTDILKLDLQLLAEEGGNNTASETANNNSTADNDDAQQAQENNASQTSEEAQEDFSAYDDDPFGGISDEVKKLVAQENNVDLEEEKQDGNNPADEGTEPKAEDKTEPTEQPPDYKKLYEEMKRKYEGGQKQQTSPPAQNITQVVDKNFNVNNPANNGVNNNAANNLLANIKLTPEMSNAIEDMAFNRALQISGMTKEEVEGLEYAEDGDANKVRFENAKAIARNSVLTDLNNRYVQMEQQRQRQIYEQQQSAADIQNFVKEIQSVENYQAVTDYVTKDYINTLPSMQQDVIRQAYLKADRGVSTIQDNMILRSFWNNGLSAYQKANNVSNQAQPSNNKAKADKINNNMTQRNKFPRVGQVRNSSGSAKNEIWTIDRCSQLVNSGQLDKIPANIKEQLMRGYLE